MQDEFKKHEEHENHERWLVSYADFITLLFAFFVVLYATSSQNPEKEKKFEESIRSQFKMVAVGSPGTGTAQEMIGTLVEPLDLFQKRGVGNAELEDHIDRLLDQKLTAAERKQAISDLKHDSMGVRISLAASTFFPTGSAKIRLPALKSLDKIAEILKASQRRIIIEGHTDNQPVLGGQFDSNWELAATRATSVVRYLVKIHKLNPAQIAAISYAEFKPVAPNDTDENRGKNRRIEVFITNE